MVYEKVPFQWLTFIGIEGGGAVLFGRAREQMRGEVARGMGKSNGYPQSTRVRTNETVG